MHDCFDENSAGRRGAVVRALGLSAALVLMGGCQLSDLPDLGLDRFFSDGPLVEEVVREAQFYPADVPVGDPVELEVVRQRDHIVIHNRTATAYDNAQVWLNQGWGQTVALVPIGTGKPLLLTDFINEHGEPYPVAGFLAPEKSRPLVAAALFRDGQLHPLTVRLEEDWQISR